MSRVAYLPRPASVLRVQANPHTCVPPASPPAHGLQLQSLWLILAAAVS